MNRFLDYIASNFKSIKNEFINRINNSGLEFDEDVFSDTIEKCSKKLADTSWLDRQMLYYFWVAFKHNTLRELNYMRNKNVTHDLPLDIPSVELDPCEEFNEISKMIVDKFGSERYQLFALHANGTPYSELEELTNIKNIKYEFRKIREYVRKNYKR